MPLECYFFAGPGDQSLSIWKLDRSKPLLSLFFAGDTALHPAFASIATRSGPFDVAILPIGAYEPRWFMGSVHMNPAYFDTAKQNLIKGQS